MSYSYTSEVVDLPIWGSNDKPTQDDLNYQNYNIAKGFKDIPFYDIVSAYLRYDDKITLTIKKSTYFLTIKGYPINVGIVSINCGNIIDIEVSRYATIIQFQPYDWFTGNINTIILRIAQKLGGV